jgi:haloalkane dehalogenase
MHIQSYDIPPSKVYRTPDERFNNLPDFDYVPRYGFLGTLRYAFIEETSGILYNGKELSNEETANLSANKIHWETILCLQ